MSDAHTPRPLAVPRHRASRALRFGSLTAGIAGRAAVAGAMGALRGQAQAPRDLLLTPANARRITAELSRMRGAAMKVGQLLSMEAEDVLTPELAALLAPLRAQAHFMPPKQLKSVLAAAWGPDFPRRFKQFDVRPMAAASIGQVHRAHTPEGRILAIKVQYPGVARAIDSDIANLRMILRLPGLVPPGLDMDPILEAARGQLHEEADYRREAEMQACFAQALEGRFIVPQVEAALCTDTVLAMDHIAGQPLEALADHPSPTRNAAATALIALCLEELFTLRLMQTDPNLGNFLYVPQQNRLALLDFGATQGFAADFTAQHRALLRAALAQDRAQIAALLHRIGYFGPPMTEPLEAQLLDLFLTATAPLRAGIHDFSACDLLERMRRVGFDLAAERSPAPVPPPPALFLLRKLGGIYLAAKRLRARVDMAALVAPYA